MDYGDVDGDNLLSLDEFKTLMKDMLKEWKPQTE